MNSEFYFILLGFLLSLIVGRLSIPRIIIISKKKRLFDIPDIRKVHSSMIPRLGGISFFPAIVISFCFVAGLYMTLQGGVDLNELILSKLLFFFTGLMIIFITGLNDDLVGMNYKQKILLQLIAALVLVVPAQPINNLGGLLGVYEIHPVIGILLATVFIVGVINSYNLIDGVDGLCSGLSLTTFVAFSALFFYHENFTLLLLCACTVGVVLAFFAYNVFGSRLKIFMGDSGSLMLGFIISFFALQYFFEQPEWSYTLRGHALIISFGIVFVPVFDTIRLFVTRMIDGKSPFYPDKNHIHHKLLSLGLTHIQSTGSIIILQLFVIIFNALMTQWCTINVILLCDIALMIGLISLLNRLNKHKKVASPTKVSKAAVGVGAK